MVGEVSSKGQYPRPSNLLQMSNNYAIRESETDTMELTTSPNTSFSPSSPIVPPIDLTKPLNRNDLTFNVNLDQNDSHSRNSFVFSKWLAVLRSVYHNPETQTNLFLLRHFSIQRDCYANMEQLIPESRIYSQSCSFALTITTMPSTA